MLSGEIRVKSKAINGPLPIFNVQSAAMKKTVLFLVTSILSLLLPAQEIQCIRINQLGYPTKGIKIAVWGAKEKTMITGFDLVDAATGKTVYHNVPGKPFGAYGPFMQTYRLRFSDFSKPGTYYLHAGKAKSPVFTIGDDVYKGAADFCLRYMRQQRSGFNPFLKDSCHTHDGYTLYGPMPDSTHIDVSGGWHDASDYLQYTTTSANATWHLLAAYRDFPAVFTDQHEANGLEGHNGNADVLDEAKWGIDWLLKMNPRDDWMFNQLGDDRDHMGMRIPKEDSFYGKGFERPVYFVNGKPQQRGKFLNATTGAASTAGKFASVFALASSIYGGHDDGFSKKLKQKAEAAYRFGQKMPGVAQTVSVRSPYIYAEGDWADDMEMAAAQLYTVTRDKKYEKDFYQYWQQDSVAKWMGKDTAAHYQYYPFNNLGLFAMGRTHAIQAKNSNVNSALSDVIQRVAAKAGKNAFNRGVPFIWCSNNLTTSFAIACYWYRQLSGKNSYEELEQANFDWLFGCNPWGTSMVYGLPANGDTPVDPHSAFTHLKNYPIDGGLVDGPVYTSIYKSLIGIQLKDADEYADFQSDLAVYHDDYGDYSTNEPTMDGTASLIYLLAAKEDANNTKNTKWMAFPPAEKLRTESQGAIIRGDSLQKKIALVFTGDEFGEGLDTISNTLTKNQIQGSFFFTGRFYRNPLFQPAIKKLIAGGNLLGPHSDQHLLYCDWTNRNKTLVTKDSLLKDLHLNEEAMKALGIAIGHGKRYFIPPYEWWNQEVADWLKAENIQLVSFTPGTTSNADYTWPEMGKSYKSSDTIMRSILLYPQKYKTSMNGVILLIHAGTDPRRTDKLYNRLDELVSNLTRQGYRFTKLDEMLW